MAKLFSGVMIGVIIGHMIPPGHLFWFIAGSVTGYLAYMISRNVEW